MKIKKIIKDDMILGIDAEIVRQICSDSRLSLTDIGVYMTILQKIGKNKIVTKTDVFLDHFDEKEDIILSLDKLCRLGYIKINDKQIIDLKNNN